jgi:SSS family solute:Na+ symporter
MTLNSFDWIIIIVYLIGMIALSFFLARGQKSDRDYYLGGNKTAPFPIALSTMATQCSTNSLLGAPAFVAFAAGGGMIWLQYELAVPVFCVFVGGISDTIIESIFCKMLTGEMKTLPADEIRSEPVRILS